MNIFLNQKMTVVMYTLVVLALDFSLMSMEEYYRPRHIDGYYISDECGTYRYFKQQLAINIFLIVREIIDGHNKGKKEVVVVREIENSCPMTLKYFDKDEAPAIAAEVIRKFTNQQEAFDYIAD